MQKYEIEVEFNADGSVKADVLCGPGGTGCLAELEAVLSGLGSETGGGEKEEMYQTTATVGQSQGNGSGSSWGNTWGE